MNKTIPLPTPVATLYNLATLECVTILYNEGLRLHINKGKITGGYLIPDNLKEVV